ncbi:MAG: class D beta-lactamase [Chitinophagales bacterium]
MKYVLIKNNLHYYFSGTMLLILSMFTSCTPVGNHRTDLKKYFDEYGVEGCIEIYDLKNSEFTDYNPDRCSQRFIPASSFKIFNSLVGLQVGAIPDEHYMMKWDSVKRREPWNHDQDMEEAFKNSTVWYYQEIARRIGAGKMQQYLSLMHYGNMNMTGAIDSFWLTGGLRISCDEQIEFLKDFYLNTYHFTPTAVNIVKKILVQDDTPGYKLSAKTGWGMMKGEETGEQELNIGWFVGYVEKGKDVYFFATNISSPEPAPDNFGAARKEITLKILQELKIVPSE